MTLENATTGTTTIRTLSNQDFEEFDALRRHSLVTNPESFWASEHEEAPERRKKFEDTNAHPDNFSIGAFVDDQLVGKMAFIRYEQEKLSFKGFIVGVYVHPNFRGLGLAKAILVETLNKAFAQQGLTKIILNVTATQVSAKRLYEKHGFKEFGFEKEGMQANGRHYDQYYLDLSKEDWLDLRKLS